MTSREKNRRKRRVILSTIFDRFISDPRFTEMEEIYTVDVKSERYYRDVHNMNEYIGTIYYNKKREPLYFDIKEKNFRQMFILFKSSFDDPSLILNSNKTKMTKYKKILNNLLKERYSAPLKEFTPFNNGTHAPNRFIGSF